MKVIKHQKEDADEVIKETNHRKIDRDTSFFLNRAVNLGLEYEEKDGGIDMCPAMEKKTEKDKISGVIEGRKIRFRHRLMMRSHKRLFLYGNCLKVNISNRKIAPAKLQVRHFC